MTPRCSLARRVIHRPEGGGGGEEIPVLIEVTPMLVPPLIYECCFIYEETLFVGVSPFEGPTQFILPPHDDDVDADPKSS